MTATRTITRFIIALCPATQTYLASVDPVFREGMNLGQATVGVPALATQFNTFEAAMEVAKGITGWGGAQRVEEIAVEVEDTRSTIATDDELIEIRDAATMAWTESKSKGCVYGAFGHASSVVKAMLDLGIECAFEAREGAASPVTIYIADYLGNTAKLDWDPMQDGFDITEAPILETCPDAALTADEPADDDRYYSGTGESMNDDSYTDSLNGPGTGWCG